MVREYAKDYFYTDKLGTIPVFARTIFNKSLKALDINYKVKSYYLKNIGFNLNTIKKSLNKNIPVVFSVTNDGRNYYKAHSITIVGYETFKLEKEGIVPKEVTMLIVYDNWSKIYSYVDYDKVSILSSIYC